MDLKALIPTAISFGAAAFVIILVIAGLFRLNGYLVKRYEHGSSAEFQRQLIMLAVSLLALIFAVLVIPVGDAMRGQILGLLGILLSATIALSSTTLVGNVLAGLMLKSLKGFKSILLLQSRKRSVYPICIQRFTTLHSFVQYH